MEKIISKKILRIKFRLESPLIIGAGRNIDTDNDIIVDGAGIPFIPGTAIAGVIRSLAESEAGRGNFSEEEVRRYFGFVPDVEEAKTIKNPKTSRIIFYDGCLEKPRDDNGKSLFHISRRDFVALDEWKTAKKGAKFDMQILEPGIDFVTYIEQNTFDKGDKDFLDDIAYWWNSGSVRFGAKTMRGFGDIKVKEIRKLTIDMTKPEAVNNWLDKTIYEDELWSDLDDLTKEGGFTKNSICLDIKLKVSSAISIRRYTTDVTRDDDPVAQPDYIQLTVHDGDRVVPVVPGSSWAGAFRSHMRKLVDGLDESCFGRVEEKTGHKEKSRILFSESKINGGEFKVISRNAIDRFSGGTVDGALYTEKTLYGGTTDLKIKFLNMDLASELKGALAASVADLHAGLLPVGGLTAVGRGLFNVTEVNGMQVPDDAEKIFNIVMKELDRQEKIRNDGKRQEVSENE